MEGFREERNNAAGLTEIGKIEGQMNDAHTDTQKLDYKTSTVKGNI